MGKALKRVFISHRTDDSEYADHLTTFMTLCGVPSDEIFCSSLPGNDVNKLIPDEIRSSLNSSKYNIIILSSSYYESAYCQNEAGIIWFSDTPFIVFALPEIDQYSMQGFINNDHKLRRFDLKNDLLFLKDELERIFSSTFVKSSEKIDTNVDKFINSCKQSLAERSASASKLNNWRINNLQEELLTGRFSESEKLIFLYFYETQRLTVDADQKPLRDWLDSVSVGDVDVATGFSTLAEGGYIEIEEDILGSPINFKLNLEKYRELRSLKQDTVNRLRENLKNNLSPKKNRNSSRIDPLIKKGFKELEMLLIQYIIDMGKANLLCGWQTNKELPQIRAWESINGLNEKLSTNGSYVSALYMLKARRFLEIGDLTSHNNPKSYNLTPDFLSGLDNLSDSSKEMLKKNMNENRADPPLPFDF